MERKLQESSIGAFYFEALLFFHFQSYHLFPLDVWLGLLAAQNQRRKKWFTHRTGKIKLGTASGVAHLSVDPLGYLFPFAELTEWICLTHSLIFHLQITGNPSNDRATGKSRTLAVNISKQSVRTVQFSHKVLHRRNETFFCRRFNQMLPEIQTAVLHEIQTPFPHINLHPGPDGRRPKFNFILRHAETLEVKRNTRRKSQK